MMLSCSRTLGLPPHLFMGNEQMFERPAPSTGMTHMRLQDCTQDLYDLTFQVWQFTQTTFDGYMMIFVRTYEDTRTHSDDVRLYVFSRYSKIYWVLLPYRLSNTVFACFFSLIDWFNLLCVHGYDFRAHGTASILIHPQCGWEMAAFLATKLWS